MCMLPEKSSCKKPDLLVAEIVDMYGCTEKEAKRMIRRSGIKKLINEDSESDDPLPLSSWAEMVWARRK